MNSNGRFNHTVTISIAAAVVLVASFLPWGYLSGATLPGGFAMPFGNLVSVTLTAWNGNVTLAGLTLPNWMVVFAAAASAGLSWARVTGTWTGHSGLFLGAGIYGLAHSGFAVLMLMSSSQGRLGIGSLVTAVAFAVLVVASFRQLGSDEPEATADASAGSPLNFN